MPILEIDGCSLYYTVKGNGIPIIFIHPPVLTSTNFTYQSEELSRYFQVITFDIRGHGRSSFSSKPVTYPLIVEDIKKIIGYLDIKQAFLCGYSAGASILLEFLLSTSRELALGGIIISGMSEVGDWRLRNRIRIAKTLVKFGALPALARSIANSNSDTEELFETMLLEAKKGNARNILQYYNYCLNYNCTEQLDKIHKPISLIYGEMDKPFSPYAQLLQKKLSQNEITFVKGMKHQVPTKAANELNKLIYQFIQNHSFKRGE
ncbi:alpha/beta fold hydrolase [Neobacillus niacini]|uniref:alpha/beta fold hydrolase n=1 Tax=Neobacillus niacini TaxID=86668 RepID=UPI0021CB969A|nr:alpha/beta hydrolase [Neobacillus niacini]MCM3767585.1 alpha/beta hydrolase [Neobacillus niacini]